MILTSTLVALPLLAIALAARRLRSDLEETAWRLMALAMLVAPFAPLLPKFDVGLRLSVAEPVKADDSFPFFVVVYMAVAIALLARLAFAVIAARKLRRDAQPFGEAYVSASVRVPLTAGLLRPAIFLPSEARTWSEAKLTAILAHERAHVTRRDPLWRFIGRAATAVCWFHPLAWLAAASIERIAEEAADREAVSLTGNPHEYASVVLELLRAMTGTRRRVLAAGMLDGRRIHQRIDAILQPATTRRSRLITRILLATFVAGAIFTTGMTTYEEPPRAAPTQIRPLTDKEFFRARGEMRKRFRETVRKTMRAVFGGFVD